MSVTRKIRTSFLAKEVPEGDGAVVRRAIGTPQLRHLTPFLMMDHATVPEGSGFPDHPHRGQETITYALNGKLEHEDFAGNTGTLEVGDLQFMTAGRGVMHSEMPVPGADGSDNEGIQIWVDLPEKLKNVEPRYRDLKAKEVPVATTDDGKVEVKIISGKSLGIDSVRDLSYTPVWYLDITMKAGSKFTQPLPADWNAFAYVMVGKATFSNGDKESRVLDQQHIVVFDQQGDSVSIEVDQDATKETRFILLAGQQLDQKIVQYGPFVTTSREAANQAVMDFQTNSNGFERARGWVSRASALRE